MNTMQAYYYKCADILKDNLEVIPELELTNAKRYFGETVRQNGVCTKIRLSKYNLYVSNFEDEDIFDLVDTIAHEFAHIIFWEHGKDHKELTVAYRKFILIKLAEKDFFSDIDMIKDNEFYNRSIANY